MKAVGAWIALAVVAVLALALYGQEQRRRGAAEAQGARWKAELDALAKVVARVDTVYRVRRDTFYVQRDRLDTMTVTVEAWKHDTVRVVEYVARADSTVRACSLALLSCDEREALRVRQLDAWQRRWDTRPKPPSALARWTERLLWGAAGYGIGHVIP